MTTPNENQPCPFCGVDAEIVNYGMQQAKCSSRNCFMSQYPSVHLTHWNTRPIESTLRARIAELERMNTTLTHALKVMQINPTATESQMIASENVMVRNENADIRKKLEWAFSRVAELEDYIRELEKWINATVKNCSVFSEPPLKGRVE